ncbi:50S ribosomal protein L2 [Myxococcota bacterium]|nr:50S ribosomal protein L2 [Myxococcota bacterium]MBU1242381.1 50S ribosomal protein L2 [Myxococcota bacterium]MBU1411272.1 50S ribosomal protein L2 [Myxococcota bacterium]MBU1509647.1 50S ribosomal protein L2 [Myxococcota bacterium]PKN27447.1 MAG: 50S ribosomal protein L2 [Deltaproteobacteria bacterium HGW-Deltaproteobacteria-22]
MGTKQYKPTSPGRRGMNTNDFSGLTKNAKPERGLIVKKANTAGRNCYGRITSRFRGGGHKQKYRLIDFRRNKTGIPAVVDSIQYDPNRTAFVALLNYVDGEKRYILSPDGMKPGDRVISVNSGSADIMPGNAMPLRFIPDGTMLHNVEMSIGHGGQLARSAGNGAQLMAKEGDWAQIRLPSGEVRKVHINCRATIGVVSNIQHNNVTIGKAGRVRWTGRRPHNRGVSMNPVDHPMGGGEGCSSGGRHPVSPWGMIAKGYRTRKNKRTDKFIVKRRHAN